MHHKSNVSVALMYAKLSSFFFALFLPLTQFPLSKKYLRHAILFSHQIPVQKYLYIIIHGTFASKALWYKPGGDFYETLKKNIPYHSTLVPFVWSGENNHAARVQAAHRLIHLIKQHPNHDYHLIGHSHGGTIACLASTILAQEKSTITLTELIILGMPIHESWAQPAMTHITMLYNVFSYGDLIQPYGNACSRIFATYHKKICNIQCTIDHFYPNHSQLHMPIIAAHIPRYKKYFPKRANYHLHLKKDGTCIITLDKQREKDLEQDKYAIASLLSSFAESRFASSPNNNEYL